MPFSTYKIINLLYKATFYITYNKTKEKGGRRGGASSQIQHNILNNNLLKKNI